MVNLSNTKYINMQSLKEDKKPEKYTCSDYRQEMMLLSLKNRMNSQNLSEDEKHTLMQEIAEIEKQMGLD